MIYKKNKKTKNQPGGVAMDLSRHLQRLSDMYLAMHACNESHPACASLQATYAPLQVFCRTEAAAQNISRSAGQAVSSAIPAAFGDAPCKPYAGKCMQSY